MRKGISTPAGIIIIVAVAIVTFGGVFAYQYAVKPQTPTPDIQPNSNSQISGTSNQNPEATGGWKTYTDIQGIQFKIPQDIYKTDFSDQNNWYFMSSQNEEKYKSNAADCLKKLAPDEFGAGCYAGTANEFSHLIIYTAPMQLAVQPNKIINNISWRREYPSAYGDIYMYSTDNDGVSYQLLSHDEQFLLEVISTFKFTN